MLPPSEQPVFGTFRDPDLSLWQSAAKAVGLETEGLPIVDANAPTPDLMAPARFVFKAVSAQQTDSLTIPEVAIDALLTDCPRVAAKVLLAEIQGKHDVAKTLLAELRKSPCDPRWVKCAETYLACKAIGANFQYRAGRDPVFKLREQSKVGIIGDWGTGEDLARSLLEEVRNAGATALIHLGDIYYSGTQEEVQRNFLNPVREVFGPGFPVYTLCGNHDMYSGGDGYYWLLDQLQQQASYFCLHNSLWQVLAMDTGYNDRDPFTVATNMTSINPRELQLLLNRIRNPEGRRTILLSHHPLFSAFSSVGRIDGEPYLYNPSLYQAFRDVLPSVECWFWGHEHNLAIYTPFMSLNRGRCVGCSAVPVFKDQQSYTLDKDTRTLETGIFPSWESKAQLTTSADDYNHGFALMTLGGEDDGTIEYFEVPAFARATPLWKESLKPVKEGASPQARDLK
jgi:hypothetical protein